MRTWLPWPATPRRVRLRACVCVCAEVGMRAGRPAAWACEDLDEGFVNCIMGGRVTALAQLGVGEKGQGLFGPTRTSYRSSASPAPCPSVQRPRATFFPLSPTRGTFWQCPVCRSQTHEKGKGNLPWGPRPLLRRNTRYERAHRAEESTEANRAAHTAWPPL